MPNDITAQSFNPEPPDYRETFLYRQAIELSAECFKLMHLFPEEERVNLVADIMQTSVKICSNIAGGYEDESRKRRLRHFDIARGKVKRLQALLIMAVKVEYLERTATTRARLLANEMDGWLKTLIKQSLKQG